MQKPGLKISYGEAVQILTPTRVKKGELRKDNCATYCLKQQGERFFRKTNKYNQWQRLFTVVEIKISEEHHADTAIDEKNAHGLAFQRRGSFIFEILTSLTKSTCSGSLLVSCTNFLYNNGGFTVFSSRRKTVTQCFLN